MKATHTPGPWAYASAHGNPMSDRITIFSGDSVIATVNNKPSAIANAALLSAAPELLAALISIFNGHNEETIAQARAAIAKAKLA